MGQIVASYFLLLLFSFAAASQHPAHDPNPSDAHDVSSDAIIALIQCHKEFEYRRGNLRQMDNNSLSRKIFKMLFPRTHGRRQMQNFMRPYFAIEEFVLKCMMRDNNKHLKAEIEKLYTIQKELFKTTGFTKWAEDMREQLEKHYVRINNKLAGDNQMKMTLGIWRRMLIPSGFLWQNAFLEFAKVLFTKVMDKMREEVNEQNTILSKNTQKHMKNYEWMRKRLADEVQNQHVLFAYSNKEKDVYFKEALNFGDYVEIFKRLTDNMNKIGIRWKEPDLEKLNFTLPKPKRVIWAIRHSQRQDGLPGMERNNQKNVFEVVKTFRRLLSFDNPPLSESGRQKLAALKNVFDAIPINHVLVCPFERNVETAQRFLDQLNQAYHEGLSIKAEPGLIRNCDEKPSYESCKVMQAAGHGRLDCDYKPVAVERCAKTEKAAEKDDALLPRIRAVMNALFDGIQPSEQLETRHDQSKLVAELKAGKVKSEWLAPGEEDAEHIVIVTHGSVIISMQQLADGKNGILPQISITKFVELDDNPSTAGNKLHSPSHHDQRPKGTFVDRLHLIYGSETKHLYTEESTDEHMEGVMKTEK